MELSTNLLTTAADCDKLTTLLEKEKGDLEFRKIQLERQRKTYEGNVLEINAELQAVNAELSSLATVIASLPDGELKTENITKQKKAELKKYLLEERQKDYGVIALVQREVEFNLTDAQLEQVNTGIAAVATRKAAL